MAVRASTAWVEQDGTPTGIARFERYHTRDELDRLITFYVSKPPRESSPLPLAVFVQGSGCHSVFRIDEDGRVRGGGQNLLLQAARAQARVLVVEKPGVECFDDPGSQGTAEHCRKAFLGEHTLPRWATALGAAVRAAKELPRIDTRKLLVVGHSEGGIVAARLAAENRSVSHVAILSGSGPTQLFDLAEEARASGSPNDAEDRVDDIYETFAHIRSDPESITEFAWGHPYRRWSSFLTTSTLDELLRSSARVYLAHGSDDTVVPAAAFEVLRAELVRHGREVIAERVEGADHGFRIRGRVEIEPMIEVLGHVIDWFVNSEP